MVEASAHILKKDKNGGAMVTTINDDMFTADVIRDPYRYYGRIREEDPVHWNELYELWVITRHDDLVWLARTARVTARHNLGVSAAGAMAG